MNPNPQGHTTPRPFICRAHPDLIHELCIDEDVLGKPPSSLEEAHACGRLFPGIFKPEDPFNSLQPAYAAYKGPSDRYVIRWLWLPGDTSPTAVILNPEGSLGYMPTGGLSDYFFSQLEIFVTQQGGSVDAFRRKLRGAPGSPPEWVIGYERGSGNVAILDRAADRNCAKLFLQREGPLALANLSAIKS